MKTKTLITAAIATLAIAAPQAASAHPHTVATSCFSAVSWSANDADRPCTTVVAPDNDVARFIQGTAGQEEAECVVDTANVADARCHTIDANRAAPTPITAPRRLPDTTQVACNPLGCSTTGEPEEDGSGLVMVHVFGHARIVCTLSNPQEEHGSYSVPCRLAR
jgi:hypothetical protein